MIDWKFGDRVRHDIRGEGIVVGVGRGVWVAFACDAGDKPEPVDFVHCSAHRWLTPIDPAPPEPSTLAAKLDEMVSMLHSLDEGVGFLVERMEPKTSRDDAMAMAKFATPMPTLSPNATAMDNPLYQVGDKVRVTRGVNKGLTAQVDQATWSPRMATGAVRLHRDGVSLGWHDYDEVEFVSRSDT